MHLNYDLISCILLFCQRDVIDKILPKRAKAISVSSHMLEEFTAIWESINQYPKFSGFHPLFLDYMVVYPTSVFNNKITVRYTNPEKKPEYIYRTGKPSYKTFIISEDVYNILTNQECIPYFSHPSMSDILSMIDTEESASEKDSDYESYESAGDVNDILERVRAVRCKKYRKNLSRCESL